MTEFINHRYQVEVTYSDEGDHIRVWDHYENRPVKHISLIGVPRQAHMVLKQAVSDLIRSIT